MQFKKLLLFVAVVIGLSFRLLPSFSMDGAPAAFQGLPTTFSALSNYHPESESPVNFNPLNVSKRFAGPTITGFTPTYAGKGTTVTITGTGFTGATAVSFGGTAATSFNVINSTSITAVVGAGASGSVSVTNSSTVSATGFNYLSAPGNGLSFDGTNDYVTVTNPTTVSNNFTVEAWVRPDVSSSKIMSIFSTRDPSDNTFDFKLQNGNLIHGDIGNGSAFYTTTADASYTYAVNKWLHIAYTVSPTGYSIYANGILVGSGTASGTPLLSNSSHPIVIGASVANTEYFQGNIDEVRVYSATLTQANIQSDMVSFTPSVPASLVAYYNFDVGNPGNTNTGLTTLYDLSSNKLNATLTNFALTGSTSNWVESYAMVVPTATAATGVTAGSTGFTANWTAPAIGTVTSYSLEVSTKADFSAPITGSPFTINAPTTSKAFTGQATGNYFYRVSALKNTAVGFSSVSNVVSTLSVNSTLSNLTTTASGFSPAFASSTLAYTASVPNATTTTTITPTVSDATATVKVNGVTVASGSASGAISLSVGDNAIPVVVTAQDGTTTTTYTLTVNRAGLPSITSFTPTYDGKGNTVTITGTSLSGATAVNFGGTAASSFTVVNSTTITAVVAAGASGNVSVTTPSGSTSLAGFNFLSAPGNALAFDGSSTYVTATNPNTVSGNFTVEAWVRPTDATNSKTMTIFSTRDPSDNTFDFKLQNGNTIHGDIGNGSSLYATADATYTYITNKWVHIAYVVTPSGFTIYADGVQVGTGTASGTPLLSNSAHPMVIGDEVQYKEYFQGNIDEVKVYSSALTQANVQYDMVNTTPSVPGSLVAYYNFDTGNPGGTNTGLTTLYDQSSNGYNGTLNNFALTGSTSNWVESYALMLPTSTAANALTATGFTANWTAPLVGVVNNYILEVSTSPTFAAGSSVSGSPFTVAGPALSKAITGLTSKATYYYRVTADKTSVTGTQQPLPGNVITVTTLSNINTLASIGLSAGSVAPTFAAATTSYTATVNNSVTSITLTPTVTDAAATVTVNGTAVPSGSASGAIALSVGDNTITTIVTAADGTTKTYTVTVTRSVQTPVFTYTGPQNYTVGTAITALPPNNTGGTVATSGPAQVTSFITNAIYGVVTDAAGNIYVSTSGNNLISKITPAGVVSTFAGAAAVGSSDGTGTAARFSNPKGLAIDAAGNIYVADSGNNLVRKISSAGVVTTIAGQGGALFNNPQGVAVDASGNVYVADLGHNTIDKITTGGTVTTFAGSGTSGSADGTGTAATFYQPTNITCDPQGNIYVSDYGYNKVRKILPSGVVRTFAGSGEYGKDNGTGTAATFYGPTSIASDASGNIYVADNGNNLIRKITSAGVVSTYAGTSSPGVANGIATNASFANLNGGIAVDVYGSLYVGDQSYTVIRKITAGAGYVISPALPAGLTISATTGIITGTPTATSTATTYTITASNNGGYGSTTLTITVTNTGYVNVLEKVNTSLTSSAAYSLRQLRNTYTHSSIIAPTGVSGFTNSTTPVVRIRRSSDNGQLDIGYTGNGDLDTATVKSFVGAGNGYVSIWYDQSGNSFDVSQGVLAQQPFIVTSGVVERSGTRPAVRFVNSSQTVLYNNIGAEKVFASSYIASAFPVVEASSSTINSSVFGYGNGTDRWQMHINEGGTLKFDVGSAYNRIQYSNDASATVIKNYSFITGTNLQQVYMGGVLQASSTTALTGCTQTQFNIGGIPAFGYYHNNHESEIIIYASTVSTTDRQTVEANQVAYYLPVAAIALDKVGIAPTVSTAYSLRQLNSKYTHAAIKKPDAITGFTNSSTPVVRVRRSLDNGMLDIGYTANGDLDTVTLKSFVGSGIGYVATWYDQGGRSFDAVQSNVYFQPFIVKAGVVQRSGVKPAISFASNYQTVLQASIPASTMFGSGYIGSVFPVLEGSTGNTSAFGYGNGTDRWQVHISEASTLKFDVSGASTFSRVQFDNTANNNNLRTYSIIANTNLQQVYINGTLKGSATNALVACTQTLFNIGGIPAFNYYHNAKESEVIVYGTALSTSDRQTMESNQSTYYFPGGQSVASTTPSFAVNVSQPSMGASDNGVSMNFTATGGTGSSDYQLQKLGTSGYTAIGFIKGDGTGSYTTTDAEPLNGNNTYRIAGTDSKGVLVYSTTVNLNVLTGGKGVSVYPNPVANSNMVVNFNLMPKGVYNLTLVDALGNVVLRKSLNYDGYTPSITIQAPVSRIGVFILNVSTTSYQRSLRLIFE